jgi:micrococcal nuclease
MKFFDVKCFLVLFFLAFTTSVIAQERHGPYKIHKFVDGDTFWVKKENGKTEKIRLNGVDTPEVK